MIKKYKIPNIRRNGNSIPKIPGLSAGADAPSAAIPLEVMEGLAEPVPAGIGVPVSANTTPAVTKRTTAISGIQKDMTPGFPLVCLDIGDDEINIFSFRTSKQNL